MTYPGITLGLDIGSNSVGSAWIDFNRKIIDLGVGIFPAGVDESEFKRGTPRNHKRREKRAQRRNIARRAARKYALRSLLTQYALLPSDDESLRELFNINPWLLRCKGLTEQMMPHEFGRVLVHLNQRRGALGVETDPDDKEQGEVKAAIDLTRKKMEEYQAGTFGELIAGEMERRRKPLLDEAGQPIPDKYYLDPVRNGTEFLFHADRTLIRQEFSKLWDKQKSFDGPLSKILNDSFRKEFDDASEDNIWRHRGAIFGQRRTYWDTGTLGRCDLEPTDRCCPLADMYAMEYRVLQTVNNIKVEWRGEEPKWLTSVERDKVIAVLRSQKKCSAKTVRKALGLDKVSLRKQNSSEEFVRLNIENDKDSQINSDWFYLEIVHEVFTEDLWRNMSDKEKDSVNLAILKFDPSVDEHATKLKAGAMKWWKLSAAAADRLVEAWKRRPRLEKRLNLSRKAIVNLLPYMNGPKAQKWYDENKKWVTQIEAREMFAKDNQNQATADQRERYSLKGVHLSKADRHFLKKHPDLLPPAPEMANPVVRKAIHEVRRHIVAYMRRYKTKPDRIVIELTRSATQPEVVRNSILANNRLQEAERKKIIEECDLAKRPLNEQKRAIERVLLCQQQRGFCAYSNLDGSKYEQISPYKAANDRNLEIDHIIPYSRSLDNSLNNKVLCYRNTNRDKGNLTAKEWLQRSGRFESFLQRFSHWEKERPRKWKNINSDVAVPADSEAPEDWLNSQLTDTAYAAVEVAAYLRNALYEGEIDGKRRVFQTKGIYTAMLRKDWQLFQTLKSGSDSTIDVEQQKHQAEKNRGDHRHHAIDAVVIALTGPEILKDVAARARGHQESLLKTGHHPRYEPLPVPKRWNSTAEFRKSVLSKIFDRFDRLGDMNIRENGVDQGQALVVAHRPIKRRVSGFLHKDDLWGAVNEEEGVFRIRCPIDQLSPKMLRMPVDETDEEARKRLIERFTNGGMEPKDAKVKAKEAVEKGHFKRLKLDPSLGKGGLVRDWALRGILRDCIASNGLNPNGFSSKEISALASEGKLKMPSGVPIKSVITIGPISDPVKIPVKDPYTRKQAINTRTGEPLFRYHISRNNHHVEIVEDIKTGKWMLRDDACVTMFEAANRLSDQLRRLKAAEASLMELKLPKHQEREQLKLIRSQIHTQFSVVNRNTDDGVRFVMSLSENETIFARRSDRPTDPPSYYIVAKLGDERIWFSPHWDARKAEFQDRWDCTYAGLKSCGSDQNIPPYKVLVSPIGKVQQMRND